MSANSQAQGKDRLNDGIGFLVHEELISHRVQKALDVVRVTGNDALHPGQIAEDDSTETAAALFGLVNRIVESGITEAQQLDALYESLPEAKREQIDRRDGRQQTDDTTPSEGGQ